MKLKKFQKNKKILKNACKLEKVILQFRRSGEMWHEVVEKWREVKYNC